MEGLKAQVAAGGAQHEESQQQKPRARMGHDEEQNPGLASLPFPMFKANQTISRERHHLPGDQEEECVRSREDQSKTEQQDVIEESENAYAFPSFPVPQITERKDGHT